MPGGAQSGEDDVVVERPVPSVLDQSALVPAENVVEPPSRFSHEVVADAPYWYGDVRAEHPDGILPAGSSVLLVAEGEAADGSAECRVVDSRGLSVTVRGAALHPLS